MSVVISEEQINQFQNDGFCILRNVIPQNLLEKLRDECQRFIREKDEEMDRKGVEVDEINHKGKRYFIALRYRDSKIMQELIFSKQMEEICKAVLGNCSKNNQALFPKTALHISSICLLKINCCITSLSLYRRAIKYRFPL